MCDDPPVSETATGVAPSHGHVEELQLGESRWPPAVALLAFMGLNIALHPGTVAKHGRWLHRIAVTFVVVLVTAALWATVLLVYDLIKVLGVTNSPGELLASGGVVWLGNNISFALLYWLIDSGGPIALTRQSAPVDFAFTQHMSPELAPPGWRPVFLDYLHLGFTNAT